MDRVDSPATVSPTQTSSKDPTQSSPQPTSSTSKASDPETLAEDADVDPQQVIQESGGIQGALEREGRTYVTAIARGQQAYYLERKTFATNLQELGLGIPLDTQAYTYTFVPVDTDKVWITATAKRSTLSSFTGAVFVTDSSINPPEVTAIACKTNEPTQAALEMPPAPDRCPKDTSKIESD
ncbi:MAG: hypothetical protein HC925_07510 [Coleofasciculaceae cyanobacterium SM2_3_26]|nr:hypothetical protein [Coleofasciculaceae cyanobacterium SM2_3_26]